MLCTFEISSAVESRNRDTGALLNSITGARAVSHKAGLIGLVRSIWVPAAL